ncbi:SUKH-4 family immunity protein [Kitasatospora sp. MBT63]|uniref:SUKH-4 family immunity protein n=1 Tax=Kitasatospora sp. MBT63 TaxID=1444768 RepID=UPI00053A25CF|nr:SUKH-4 family immunity protein [Kitasatospora sp. MBT63]
MAYLVGRTELESVFPPELLVTLDAAVAQGIGHGPTRDFLVRVGLPDKPAAWFEVSEEICDGEFEIGFEEIADDHPGLSFDLSRWINLGGLSYDDIALDSSTGEVYCLPDDGSAPYLLNRSLDAFAYFLYLLEVERPNYDFEAGDGTFEDGAERRLRARMEAADGTAFAHPGSAWTTVLQYVSTKLQ